MTIDRPTSVRVPLSTDEHEMLRELAEAEDISAAALLRRYIRKAHAKIVRSKQRKPPTTKRGS
jgi:hypothetical protein